MNTKNYFRAAVTALAMPLILSSCSKQNDAEPTEQITAKTDVSTLNGRLVFANQQSFDRVFNNLEEISTHDDSKKELALWESQHNFTSLRVAANDESAHLAELDTQGKVAQAYKILTRFSFPSFYAAIINPSGEYQIGDKIYWFHDGFRYQAASESELAAIKNNPSQAQNKFAAGSYTVNSGISKVGKGGIDSNFITNTVVQGNDPEAYDRYNYEFRYPQDYNSRRRIIYATTVYVEDRGTNSGLKHFYTNIRFQLKLEYFNNYYNKWYPSHEGYAYTYGFDFSGSTSPANGSPYTNSGTKRMRLDRTAETGDGLYDITMAQDDMYASVINFNQDNSNVRWTFDMNGVVSSYAKNASSVVYRIGPGSIW